MSWNSRNTVALASLSAINGVAIANVAALNGIAKSATATKLQVYTQPDGAVAGASFTQQPVVRAVSAGGSLDTTFTGNVTLAVFSGDGSLAGTATVAAVAGVATFSGLSIDTAGHHVLEATASGLTSAHSGYMSVMLAAATARTVLAFGAATSDKGNCGSGSSLDNLASGTFTVMMRVRRTATGNNQFLIGKYAAGAAGWYLQFDDGTATGDIAAFVGRGTADAFALTTGAGNRVSVGSWYDVGITWDAADATRSLRIFLAPVGTAIAEVSAYDAVTGNGSGSANTDAAAELWIGNIEVLPANPAKADIEWCAVFAGILTNAQKLQVQQGFDRASTAQITGAGTSVMLHRMNATGTLTDLSGNSNSCVITGATTTSGETVHVPSVWGEAPDAIDETNHLDTGSHGALTYTTTATSLTLGLYRNPALTTPDLDGQAAIAIEVDGGYETQAAAGSTTGLKYVTVALPGGSQTVKIINGPATRSGSPGTGNRAPGTIVTSLRFNAAATPIIPATVHPDIWWTDSIFAGFKTNPVGEHGPLDQHRRFLAGSRQLMVDGYGGQSLYKLASDGTARAATVARLLTQSPGRLFIHLMANDYLAALWDDADYGTAAAAILDAINAARPDLPIVWITSVTLGTGEAANGLGSTLADYRAAIEALEASRSTWLAVTDGPSEVWNSPVGERDADGLHENNDGGDSIAAALETVAG